MYSEFHWFCKLSHMWSDIDRLKTAVAGITAEKKFNLKSKLLAAVSSMQSALSGLGGDLGTAFRVPIVLTDEATPVSSPKNLSGF